MQQNPTVTNGGNHQYSPLQQRKSLSSLYKEKQLKDSSGVLANGSSNNFQIHGPLTSFSPPAFKTDINGNTDTDSNNIRSAFQTVLSDILGRDVEIDGGNNKIKKEKVVEDDGKKPTKQLSRSYAVDYSNNTAASYPIKITNAAKPSELELQESKRRILDQVKRSRQGKENCKFNSVDIQSYVNYDKKPLRSILKKKSMSTSEPNLNGDLAASPSPATSTVGHHPATSTVRHSAEIERTEVVTKSSIELKRPLEMDKTVISVKLQPVKSGFTSLRPGVGFSQNQQIAVDNKPSSLTMDTVRRDLPDVVNDPSKKTVVHQEPQKLPSPSVGIQMSPMKSPYSESPLKSPYSESPMKSPYSESPMMKSPYSENGHDKFYHHTEHDDYRDWDPKILLENLYDIDYTPRAESKKRKFVNMEGHLEHLPLGLRVAVVDNLWRTHYFKTKDGRLLWFEVSVTCFDRFNFVSVAFDF